MSIRSIFIAGAACAAAMALTAPAFGQAAVMKECGAKWQAAKAANTTGNQTWPQFLSKCRAESAASTGAQPAAAKPAAAKPAAAAPAAAKPAAASTTAAKPAAASTAAAPRGMIFPTQVDPKYSKESAGLARNKTCADQYNKNKQAGGKGNAGLLYIPKEKGGQGYWPLCNAALKR